MAVSWFWSGGVDESSAVVVAKLSAAAASCRLSVSTDSAFTSPSFGVAAAPDANNYVKLTKTGLVADTQYWYRVEIDGVVDAGITGKFRTFPVPGTPTTLDLVFGACMKANSNNVIYDVIAARAPRLLIQVGDFYYLTVNDDTEAEMRVFVEAQHAASHQLPLWRDVPVAYTWDDHDFGNDNSDSTWVGRAAAANVFRQTVPHYPLPAGTGNNPVYQAFTIARVRVILTDLRHQRSPDSAADNSAKTMMGATQKQWFKDQLAAAEADPNIKLIVWGNSQCWVYDSGSIQFDTDHWGQFSTERRELIDWWKANITKSMVILSGDSHAVMYHDGQGMTYGSSGVDKRLPVFHAAAIDPTAGNSKGGPYTSGAPIVNVGTDGHYGVFRVEDLVDVMNITYEARRVNSATAAETLLLSYTYQIDVSDPPPPPPPPAADWEEHSVMVFDGTDWVHRSVKTWDGAAWVERPANVFLEP